MPQMAFHFNAANCIGCQSCAAACGEKNALTPEIAWRKVGVIEGGLWPETVRVNISMACNHCHTPVCLKGCPTRAYRKDTATGAVIVDSETCIGCKYCTFVCPYCAPVFDPAKGSVSKCNFCIDRQAEGLEPACVSACLGHALTFGPLAGMGNRGSGGEALKEMPGLPPAGITRPSIRFAAANHLPERLERLDRTPLSYRPARNGTGPEAIAHPSSRSRFGGSGVRWSDAEAPLVAFTLLTQAVVGAFVYLIATFGPGRAAGWTGAGLVPLLALGMAASTWHLGKPLRAYRAIRNLRTSWLSREIAAVGGMFGGLTAVSGLAAAPLLRGWGIDATIPDAVAASSHWIAWGTAGVGLAALFAQARIYVVPARPYWNDRNTTAQFILSAVTVGPLLAETLVGLSAMIGVVPAESADPARVRIAWAASLAGLLAQGLLHADHILRIARTRNEAHLSFLDIVGQFGRLSAGRVALWAIGVLVLAGGLATSSGNGGLVSGLALGIVTVGEILGRGLFYLAAVPMTVPGGPFYRNRFFESAVLPRAKERSNGFEKP